MSNYKVTVDEAYYDKPLRCYDERSNRPSMYDDTVMVNKAYYNKLKGQTTWVSVKDRLPKSDGFYLAWFTFEDGLRGYDIFYYNCGVSLPSSLTHWMPLPEPPKDDEE